MNDITSAQMRAARGLLRWSAEELAGKAKVGVATIRRAEASDAPLTMTQANQAAIRAALEAGGVAFVDQNGMGPGVRLRDRNTTAEGEHSAA